MTNNNDIELPQNISEENIDEAIYQVIEKYGENALWTMIIVSLLCADKNYLKLPREINQCDNDKSNSGSI